MRQLLQSASDDTTHVTDVPAPGVMPGCVLVRNSASLVSAGTERTTVEFTRKSLLQKARSRPDLVKKVLDKARTDGVLTAFKATMSRLDQPMALGYSSAGVVLEVGEGVDDFRAGDRVACAGGGYASHAEVVCVPRNLVAHVPDGVDLHHAAFATVGAIGLHGVRLAEVQLGERVAVIGLGPIGLLTVQMLRASGAKVLGVDLDPARVELARQLGADVAMAICDGDAVEAALEFSGGVGVDAVLVTAGTSSNDPIEMAGQIARDRGRVVVVGAVGMDLPRPPFYEKELSFRVSRSYGPGRYDPAYEEGGVDYPLGYVRWTENRNLSAFLELVQAGSVQLEPVITHRIPIAEGADAYALLTSRTEQALGVLLTYENDGTARAQARRVTLPSSSLTGMEGDPGVGVVGAGNFATATMLPSMKAAGGLRFTGVVSARGPSAGHAARKYGFRFAASDLDAILSDDATDLVAILTRHDLHAAQITAALRAGKHVFCEKPPCLDEGELVSILRELNGAPGRMLTVGYNRRFAPMVRKLREHFALVQEPLAVSIRVNGGFIPASHWVHDPAVGGGRIIGEVCHFVDLAGFLTGAQPQTVFARALPDGGRYREDNVAITLGMSDGSVATITYVASGDRGMGKERFEVFGGGRSAMLDDFRELSLFAEGRGGGQKARLSQDKGHRGEWEALRRVLKEGGEAPISVASLVATSLATFAAVRSLRDGGEVRVDVNTFLDGVAVGGAGLA